MAHYVDGYVLPVPKKNLAIYRRIALKAAKLWREHGALEYRECVGDDLDVKMVLSFPRGLKIKPGETVELAPESYHLMLRGLTKPIAQGPNIKGTLTFEKAGSVDVDYKVEAPGASMSADHMHHEP